MLVPDTDLRLRVHGGLKRLEQSACEIYITIASENGNGMTSELVCKL